MRRSRHRPLVRRALLLLSCLAVALLAACASTTDFATTVQVVPGGNPAQGQQAIVRYGCNSCHTIPGIANANGLVGPPLTGIGGRAYIAGMLPNTPDNMIYWIQNPQQVVPGNAMPNLGVSDADARDIAAYLATLTSQPR